MSDTPPIDESTETPPPPPPPGAEPVDEPIPRGLRRSRSDRVIAGVAGGLGRYFGVDPVIVRVGFILLTIFGGSGILLYLLAWIVIAKEGSDDTAAMRALRGSPEGNRGLLFLVLGVGAILVLASPLVWWDGFGVGDGLALPLLLIAAGIAFLIWPAESDWHQRWHDRKDAPIAAPTEQEQSELTEARDSFQRQRREWPHGYREGRGGRHREAKPPKAPKPAPFLGPLTMAVLLVFAGLSLVAEQADWWDLDPAVYGGIVLAIIGAALVLSARVGRARGLIVAGALILPVAWALSAIDIEWYEGTGESVETVPSLSELEHAYTFGIGEFTVDLSDVILDGAKRSVDVGLSIGELTVFVPEDMSVDVEVFTEFGEVNIDDVDRFLTQDGPNSRVGGVLAGAEDGRLDLNVEVGFGEATVHVCTDSDTPGLVPCPS